jgi:hypothetical protein
MWYVNSWPAQSSVPLQNENNPSFPPCIYPEIPTQKKLGENRDFAYQEFDDFLHTQMKSWSKLLRTDLLARSLAWNQGGQGEVWNYLAESAIVFDYYSMASKV